MITFAHLWLAIVGSAVAVFVLSSLVHMVLKWHNSDYRGLSNEDEVRTALQKSNPSPGQYMLPYCPDMKKMQTPEFQKKFADGPVAFLLLRPRGLPNMGPALGQWFGYTAVISLFAAYIASRTLPVGAPTIAVFRLVATATFLAYAGGAVPNGIWMGKPWRSVAKELVDALIYAVATGCVFACLWPH